MLRPISDVHAAVAVAEHAVLAPPGHDLDNIRTMVDDGAASVQSIVAISSSISIPEHSRREISALLPYNHPGLKDSTTSRAVRVRTPSRACIEHASHSGPTRKHPVPQPPVPGHRPVTGTDRPLDRPLKRQALINDAVIDSDDTATPLYTAASASKVAQASLRRGPPQLRPRRRSSAPRRLDPSTVASRWSSFDEQVPVVPPPASAQPQPRPLVEGDAVAVYFALERDETNQRGSQGGSPSGYWAEGTVLSIGPGQTATVMYMDGLLKHAITDFNPARYGLKWVQLQLPARDVHVQRRSGKINGQASSSSRAHLDKHRYAVLPLWHRVPKGVAADLHTLNTDLHFRRGWVPLTIFSTSDERIVDPNRSQNSWMDNGKAAGPWLVGLGITLSMTNDSRSVQCPCTVTSWRPEGPSYLLESPPDKRWKLGWLNLADFKWRWNGRGAGPWLANARIRILDTSEDVFYTGVIVSVNAATHLTVVLYPSGVSQSLDLRKLNFELLEGVALPDHDPAVATTDGPAAGGQPGARSTSGMQSGSTLVDCDVCVEYNGKTRQGIVAKWDADQQLAQVIWPGHGGEWVDLSTEGWSLVNGIAVDAITGSTPPWHRPSPTDQTPSLRKVVDDAMAVMQQAGLVGAMSLCERDCSILATNAVPDDVHEGQRLHLDGGQAGVVHAFGPISADHCVPISVVIPLTDTVKLDMNPELTALIASRQYESTSAKELGRIRKHGRELLQIRVGEFVVFTHDFVHAGSKDSPNHRMFLSLRNAHALGSVVVA